MNLIESFTLGKNKDQKKCEDGFLVTDNFAVVVDGATSKSDMDFGNMTSGKYIKNLIIDSILKIDSDVDSFNFISKLSNLIKEDYKEKGWIELFEKEPKFRPTASVVVYSKAKNEIWFFGDCRAAIISKSGKLKQFGNEKYIDNLNADIRKYYIESELLKGKKIDDLVKDDTGRKYIEKLLEFQQLHQNLPQDKRTAFSYSAVDGWEFDQKDISCIKLTNRAKEVILTTDGYTEIKHTLKETEEFLQYNLKLDPLCINELKGLKSKKHNDNSFDDRTYIRFPI